MMRIITAFAAPCVLFSWSSANAAEFSINRSSDGTAFISIDGNINLGDENRFTNLSANYESAVVVLNSDGGSTLAAIKIGEAIHLKEYATAVLNGYACNSACALIWLGGTPRAISKTARIGFHATYIDIAGKAQESGLGNAIVGRYLTLLNLPEKAVVFATSSSPANLNFLTSNNISESGIDSRVIDDVHQELVSNSSQSANGETNGSNSTEVSKWKDVGHWQVAVDQTIGNGCFMFASWTGGTVLRFGFSPNNQNSAYFLIGNEAWNSLSVNGEYELNLQFDTRTPWSVTSKVILIGGSKFLTKNFQDDKFWGEFKKATSILISYNGKQVDHLSLERSGDAYAEMAKCQAAQHRPSNDPFAK